eukprot:Opistho-2@86646
MSKGEVEAQGADAAGSGPKAGRLFVRAAHMTKWIVTGATFVVLVKFRTTEVIHFVSGACLCALLGRALKRTIKQPRPPTAVGMTGYGMPSSHGQTISFFGTYIFLAANHYRDAILSGLGALPSDSGRAAVTACGAAAVALSGWVSWSRVRLGFHTPAQVLVGVGVGTAFGASWFYLCHSAFARSLL